MPENKIDSAVIGKYCIVRGDRFGVLAGTVEAVDGDRVLLKDARKLHIGTAPPLSSSSPSTVPPLPRTAASQSPWKASCSPAPSRSFLPPKRQRPLSAG